MSAINSSALNPQGQGLRQSARQTRTNPSRTSKTIGRSSFGFGRGSTTEIASEAPVPHGFYPAITHFTDAITALPREFRRHNSLLKEVDAKAWALEENLLQLLQLSLDSQPVPYPPHPAPIVGGVVREDFMPKELTQAPETSESKNRRLLFDRVRQNLSDLMMTADEKNHVISNANEELDRQILRLDTIFPYIAGEVSEEARLGSLTHWAYSNKSTTKTTANERPRREAVNHRHDIANAMHEAEAASRSEARREAVMARKQRRGHVDADYEETRGSRKTATKTSRVDSGEPSAAPKRRKVVAPPAVEMSTPMDRSASGAGSRGGAAKDADKKRSRATNAGSSGTAAARKKPNSNSNAASPAIPPSPLIGTFNAPRSPGPARPQTSRAQQNAGVTSNSRQRPTSSASNRVGQPTTSKAADPRSTPRDGLVKPEIGNPDVHHDYEGGMGSRVSVPAGTRRDELDGRPTESSHPEPAPPRNTEGPAKRTNKKTVPAPAIPSDEESIHEGDDEDEEGEPRYCYCNEISFGEMVACDNDACPREWFHLSCVGLTKPPGKNVKWYCNECKDNMRRGRNGR
ncbi:hypothetical protein N7470_000209 [Penicillium chermesinum]|nr:hypothetical protein N7470_000209 [Penicillium chermesinum]